MLKKILLRIVLLSALLVLMNLVYVRWFLASDLKTNSDLSQLVNDIPYDTEILYVAESSNTAVDISDADPRPISSFLADHYPSLKVAHLTKPAGHAGIFKMLLRRIPSDSKIKTVVVTLNLRSFGPAWIHSGLETPLQKSAVLIEPYPPLFNRFLLSFKGYDIKTPDERHAKVMEAWQNDPLGIPGGFRYQTVSAWDHGMAEQGIIDEAGNHDSAATELACHYIKTYGFRIDTLHNPRIDDFNAIIKLAKQRNWNLVFNLLAENITQARVLAGDELATLMDDNARILLEYFGNRGINTVNNLYAVDSSQFIDKNWTTEHYLEKGRKTVAKNVAEALKKYHGNHFLPQQYSDGFPSQFFNNCERDLIWGQSQTITTQKAYSGKKSSVTGRGNPFGLTFSCSLRQLPDSLKHRVVIEFRILQTPGNHDAQLAIEASGSGMGYFWKGYPIKELVLQTKTWELYRKVFEIPAAVKEAEAFKIYLYNTSSTLIYTDDFLIRFE